jgi:hypothetical protein
MKAPSAVALLLLAAAWMGQAQPACPVLLARKAPAKAVMAGRGLTTSLKVTNPGSRPVLVNVVVGLPDDVCATKNGMWHGRSRQLMKRCRAHIRQSAPSSTES